MMIQNALQAEICLGGGGGRDDIRTHAEPVPQSGPYSLRLTRPARRAARAWHAPNDPVPKC